MPYTPQTWTDGISVANAATLGHIEQGVANAAAAADAAVNVVDRVLLRGAQAVADNVLPPGLVFPVQTTLTRVDLAVGTAPVGSALNVQLRQGSTVLAPVSVAAGATTGSLDLTGSSTALTTITFASGMDSRLPTLSGSPSVVSGQLNLGNGHAVQTNTHWAPNVTQMEAVNVASDLALSVRLLGDSANRVDFEYFGGNLTLRLRNNSSNSDVNITYDSTAHRWWRIRLVSGNWEWSTSPDSSTWTTRRTVADPFNAAASWVYAYVGNIVGGTALVDNVGLTALGQVSGPQRIVASTPVQFDVTQIGSTTAGSDLMVAMTTNATATPA